MRLATPIGGSETQEGQGAKTGGGGGGRKVAALVIIIVLIVGLIYYIPGVNQSLNFSSYASDIEPELHSFFPQFFPEPSNASQVGGQYSLYDPTIQSGTSHITYPPDNATLFAYAVSIINQDRSTAGLSPVTLSPIQSGQQHADSMLYYGYFAHLDPQGYKPYMRYSLFGGTGAMEENVAYEYYSGPHFSNAEQVESALNGLEYQMMYNDSACCQNGHMMNIMTPLHNRVSIGVAYNETTLYFVEDFENYYMDLNMTTSQSYEVTMAGTPTGTFQATQVAVFYDPPPTNLTLAQLNTDQHSYDPGTLLGGVLPPCTLDCSYFPGSITVYADNWTFTASQVDLQFSLAKFVQADGAGVYTLYILTGSDTSTAITSISIFVTG